MDPLIPGLLDEVAELCLTRIPRSEFRTISHVCSRWRRLIMREEQFMCVLMDNMYSEVFDGSGNTMGQIPPVPGPLKCGYGLMVLDGRKIVLVGGKYKARRSKVRGLKVRRAFEVREPAFTNAVSANVHEFNPATNRWRKLADMNIPRHNFACAEVEGLLYVIRGYSADDVSILNAEVYNPKTNKWSLMDCPHHPNFSPAFAFSFNTKLFVVGNKSRFIDIYDPRKKTWEELDSRRKLDVYSYTVVSNKVYFLNRYRSGVGVFDPEKNSWSSVDVPKTFSRSSLGQLNNKVILYSRGIGYGLDKEDEAKWRATPITISGFEAISVLINF
ncbi:putative F-box/kelch-repeat protein At1g27420 [Raphanus sativus]|uniref:F-box/kelch-repeat protein At1g27420 n=1 Tax=Raphanus sativus TaxID=3726 RepID=A0A6J0LPZ0_RAPSA|nr:putative F-box/kelch-repeat protein At1g27420 [Raphanus sativus]